MNGSWQGTGRASLPRLGRMSPRLRHPGNRQRREKWDIVILHRNQFTKTKKAKQVQWLTDLALDGVEVVVKL